MLRNAIHMCSVQKFTSILVSKYIHSKYNSQQCSSWSPGSVFTSKHSGPRTADSCLLGKYPVATSFGGKCRGNPRRQQSRDHDTANRGPGTGGGRRVGEHGGKAEATINKQFTRSIQDLNDDNSDAVQRDSAAAWMSYTMLVHLLTVSSRVHNACMYRLSVANDACLPQFRAPGLVVTLCASQPHSSDPSVRSSSLSSWYSWPPTGRDRLRLTTLTTNHHGGGANREFWKTLVYTSDAHVRYNPCDRWSSSYHDEIYFDSEGLW